MTVALAQLTRDRKKDGLRTQILNSYFQPLATTQITGIPQPTVDLPFLYSSFNNYLLMTFQVPSPTIERKSRAGTAQWKRLDYRANQDRNLIFLWITSFPTPFIKYLIIPHYFILLLVHTPRSHIFIGMFLGSL